MQIISKDRKKGTCTECETYVRDMLFIKDEENRFRYICYDCGGRADLIPHNRKDLLTYKVEIIDEERLAREELVTVLIDLADEDEQLLNDPRLNIIHTFKDEILDGIITPQLENYVKFCGNDIRDVLRIRNYALSAVGLEDTKYKELVFLYTCSRIRKLSEKELNRIELLLCDRDIQELDLDNRKVYSQLPQIKKEVDRHNSKRYEHIDDIKKLLEVYDVNGFLTEQQLQRLKTFYFEMLRRKK